MRTVGNKKKQNRPPRQLPLIHFCLGCKNKGVNMFDEPCNECNKEYHSQHIKPKKPLHYTGGAF